MITLKIIYRGKGKGKGSVHGGEVLRVLSLSPCHGHKMSRHVAVIRRQPTRQPVAKAGRDPCPVEGRKERQAGKGSAWW